jgi:hypothetical protein
MGIPDLGPEKRLFGKPPEVPSCFVGIGTFQPSRVTNQAVSELLIICSCGLDRSTQLR